MGKSIKTINLKNETIGVIKSLGNTFNFSKWVEERVEDEFGSINFLIQKQKKLEKEVKETEDSIRLRKKYNKELVKQEYTSVEQEVNAGLNWWNNLIHNNNAEMIFKNRLYNELYRRKLNINQFLKIYEKAEQIIKDKIKKGELKEPLKNKEGVCYG